MSRLIQAKVITADWKEVDIYNTDITNVITDAMINNSIIKVNYKDSGWRNCLPYGWYITKDNNVIMYVYKEDLSIRSYRLDRVLGLFIDDKLDTEINKEQEDPNKDEIEEKIEDLEIFELPENNEEIVELSETEEGAETPFDESLEILENDFNVPQGLESDWRTLNKMMEQNNNIGQDSDFAQNSDNNSFEMNQDNNLTNNDTNNLTNNVANIKLKRLIRRN